MKNFVQIKFYDRICGDIRSLLIEATVDVDTVLYHEGYMSETVNIRQFVPIRRISIIDIQRHRLSYLVTPTTNNQQKSTHKHTPMLVSLRRLRIITIRRTHPVKPTISMFPQTPSIIQRRPISTSTPKNDHHTACCPCSAYTSCVVNPRRWVL